MIRRLRIQFVAVIMSIVTAMLAVITILVLTMTQNSLERESLAMMRQVALEPMRVERPNETFTGIRLPYFVLEVLDDGQVLELRGGYYDLSDREFLQQIAAQALAGEEESGVLPGYGLRYLHMDSGAGNYLIFTDTSNEVSILHQLTMTWIVIDVVTFLLFLLISTLLAVWITRPVDAAWKRQRQFVADASHDLKTPLTVILTNAELLRGDYGQDEKARFADNILTESQQMRGLIESLLTLARLDHRKCAPRRERLDWSEAVARAVLPFEPVLYERGLGLETDIAPGLAVRGDPEQLQRAVETLLDNAQKYAAPRSTVTLRLARQGARGVLSVSNQGDPIDRADLKNIFKRFYRADPARSHNGSYGLGLSIAQSIVRRHKGRIWAESENGRNTFFIRLPLAR